LTLGVTDLLTTFFGILPVNTLATSSAILMGARSKAGVEYEAE
jgi:hypothetical protein